MYISQHCEWIENGCAFIRFLSSFEVYLSTRIEAHVALAFDQEPSDHVRAFNSGTYDGYSLYILHNTRYLHVQMKEAATSTPSRSRESIY